MNQTAKEERRRDMFSLIMKYEESNISARDFYHQHNLPEHIFYYWRRKSKEAQGSVEQGSIPVEIGSPVVPPVRDAEGDIQIHFPNGVLITLGKSSPSPFFSIGQLLNLAQLFS